MRTALLLWTTLVWQPLAPVPRTAGGRIVGVVYDSVGRVPLAGAHVQVLPLEPSLQLAGRRTTESDSSGRFAVDQLADGRYLAGFFHPKLDSLGLDPPVRRVDVRGGRDVSLDLAVPSPAAVLDLWCGERAGRDTTGVVLGYVRDVHTAAPLERATVAARWSAITLGARGARAGVEEVFARTSAAGWFGLCGVPRGAVVVLRATTTTDSSALLELDIPENGVLVRDIALSRSENRPPVPVPLAGWVHDASGQPLAGARVHLWGTAVEARTNEDGGFRLVALNAGTQLVEARMIGFVPLRRVVDVTPDSGAHLELTMTEFPMDIDTVRVLAARPRSREALAGFERRRRLGYGVFFDAEQLELRRALVFTDLLRGVAGVSVRSTDMMSRAIVMQGSSGAVCAPALVVDGLRLPTADLNVDDVVPADLVRAIEVYARRIQAPPEYQTTDCGSVVVWTGLRGWMARRLSRPR